MARPVKHGGSTRAAVLDAAEALLAEGGPSLVTVRAVAGRLGESTRVVYSQFDSMAALMGALGARGFRLLADLVTAVPETHDPLHDLVEVGAGAFRTFATTRPHLFRITFHQISEEITDQAEAAPALMASYNALADRFRRAVNLGALPERSLVEYAFSFHAITSGLAANEVSMQPPPVGANFWGRAGELDLPLVWRRTLSAYLKGLATPPAD